MTRFARLSDVAAMATLQAQALEASWDRHSFRRALTDPDVFIFVATVSSEADATHEERVVGFALARLLGDEGELLNVAVDAAWRRRGHGRALLRLVMRALALAGASSVVLETRDTNAIAQALYISEGFVCVGHSVNYYDDGAARRVYRALCRVPL